MLARVIVELSFRSCAGLTCLYAFLLSDLLSSIALFAQGKSNVEGIKFTVQTKEELLSSLKIAMRL